jgi:two-component system, chemotaxis family, chemotaxis protein CheY
MKQFMNNANNSFEQLDKHEPSFSEEQVFKLIKAIKERTSKKGLESFGTSILIVEDQDFSRKLLYDLLARQFVYTCYVAKNATEALELYATHAPDIAFLDIVLPDYSGHDIAVLIKNHDPRSHIIMVTANNILKDVETAKKNNVQGYITKPYSKNKIQAAIDHYINTQAR